MVSEEFEDIKGALVVSRNQRVLLVEEELLTLPEHLSSSRFLMGFVLLDL
jgi:hypothetical protein